MATDMNVGDVVRDTRDGVTCTFNWFFDGKKIAYLIEVKTEKAREVPWEEMVAHYVTANPVPVKKRTARK
jgi:hypothetical protein